MALEFMAGCLGGAAGVLVGHPFDTIKVRLQTQHGIGPTLQYKGAVDCFMQTVKKESVSGLYKGLTPPLLGLAAINAIIFGVHGNTLKCMEPGLRSEAVAGGVAGLVQTVILCPVELVKTKLQIQGQGKKVLKGEAEFKGPLDCLRKIYRKEGINGCMRGMVSTVIRDGPGFMFYFGTYAFLCHKFTPEGGTIHDVGALSLLLCGGLSGTFSWMISYPCDVIKSRIQAEGLLPHGKYRSYVHCITEGTKNEGYTMFYRGLGVTLVRAFPVNAATFATVTLFLRFVRSFET